MKTIKAYEAIDRHTNASGRVFMPEAARKMQVPVEARQYLGKWMEPKMADTYTRECRMEVVNIWKKFLENKHVMSSTASVPLDIRDIHYGEFKGQESRGHQEETPGKDAWQPPKRSEKDLEEIEKKVRSGWSLNKRNAVKDIKQLLKETQASKKMEVDICPAHLGGPLAMVVRKATKEANNALLKIHLMRRNGTLIGCATRQGNYTQITDIETQQVVNGTDKTMGQCGNCFKAFTWPTTSNQEDQQQPARETSDVSSSDDSDSDSTADTASEEEALVMVDDYEGVEEAHVPTILTTK